MPSPCVRDDINKTLYQASQTTLGYAVHRYSTSCIASNPPLLLPRSFIYAPANLLYCPVKKQIAPRYSYIFLKVMTLGSSSTSEVLSSETPRARKVRLSGDTRTIYSISSTKSWSSYHLSNCKAFPRVGHSANVGQDNQVYIFGGVGRDRNGENDIHVVNPSIPIQLLLAHRLGSGAAYSRKMSGKGPAILRPASVCVGDMFISKGFYIFVF